MRHRGLLAATALLVAGGGIWMKWGTRTTPSETRKTPSLTPLVVRKDEIKKTTDAELVIPLEEQLVRTWGESGSEGKILGLVRGRGLSDPAATLEILGKQQQGYLRTQAFLALAESWARINPQAAAAAILQKFSAPDLDRLLGQVVGIWILSSPADCLAWLNSKISDPASKALQLQHAYAVWARDSPGKALDGLVGDARTTGNLRAVFSTFADADFPSAIEHYNHLPATEQNSLQESLVLIGAAEGAPETDRLLDDFLRSHGAEDERIQLGRNLVSIDRDLAEKIAGSGSSDEQSKRIKDRIFHGVAIDRPEDPAVELTEMPGKLALPGVGHKSAADSAVPSIGIPKEAALGNEATR